MKKHGIIMGDFNINLLKYDIHNPTNDFINNTLSQGFVPVITKPTRLTHSSATIIDHIYTNCITTKSKSGIILNDVADHFGIFYMMNQCKSQQTPNINKIRYYTEQNTEQFINLIRKQDFTKVHNLYDTDLAYNEFLSIINSAHDKAFPIQIAKEKKHVIRKEPWITSGLMTSSHNKTKLHRKKIKNPTPRNINKYKNYLKLFNKLKRQIKKLYYEKLFEKNKKNLKQIWTELRKVINKQNNKKELPTKIKISDGGRCQMPCRNIDR
jgi:molecular chaperone DnaK (HSP70)